MAANDQKVAEELGIVPPPPASLESLGQAPGRGRLVGKKILVVGGGQMVNDFDPNPSVGNGRASCVLCAREGATVIVADISREAAQGTVDIIEKEGIGKAQVLVGDVSTPEGCVAIVKGALELLDGQLDCLVLGVGIVGGGASLSKLSPEYWDRVMNANLRAHHLIMQEALPYIEKAPLGGSVVAFASVAAHLPVSDEPAYHASKAGLVTLIKNVAYQFAPKVRVNSISPGLIDTPLGRKGGATIQGRNASAVPASRQGSGWDIAYGVVWLLSGESSFVTAQDIIIDGGACGCYRPAKRADVVPQGYSKK
jgi:NAD(P)-dependent dehydrogenase (short-subunit alcohol dehydrogenase family)